MSGPGAPRPWGLRVRRVLAAWVCVGAQLLSAGAARASLAEDVGRLREIWRAGGRVEQLRPRLSSRGETMPLPLPLWASEPSSEGCVSVAVLASPREIARLIKVHFGVGGETVSAMMKEREDEIELLDGFEADDSEAAKMAQEASVVKLVNEILVEAANERASDIHVEPEEATLRIRYRIDGLLQTQSLPPEISRFQSAIISRIKIMSRLNIAEKRLPQDGRIKMRVQGRDIDVRVSIIPMAHGEGICMRLLDKGRMVFNLANVGMLEDTYALFKKLIDLPHGILLVTVRAQAQGNRDGGDGNIDSYSELGHDNAEGAPLRLGKTRDPEPDVVQVFPAPNQAQSSDGSEDQQTESVSRQHPRGDRAGRRLEAKYQDRQDQARAEDGSGEGAERKPCPSWPQLGRSHPGRLREAMFDRTPLGTKRLANR